MKAKNWNEMQFEEIDRQLDKLAYIEEPATMNYLAEIKNWKQDLQGTYPLIKKCIDDFTKRLLETHPENFSMEANKHYFKTYIFKSKANSLTIEDLQKGLNTPNKILSIKKLLRIE
ncbi:hypothetical protein [Niastella vici]|uniref:hypothetical protein n=1 Tax=Niastella vici TaxID=1703345 RepID=UPI001C1F3A9F|nr:hypothetical protein [Niastella vici]